MGHSKSFRADGKVRGGDGSASRRVDEAEAAEYLAVSVLTMRRWRWARTGPAFLKLGSAVRYDTRDLDAFLRAGRREPVEAA